MSFAKKCIITLEALVLGACAKEGQSTTDPLPLPEDMEANKSGMSFMASPATTTSIFPRSSEPISGKPAGVS